METIPLPGKYLDQVIVSGRVLVYQDDCLMAWLHAGDVPSSYSIYSYCLCSSYGEDSQPAFGEILQSRHQKIALTNDNIQVQITVKALWLLSGTTARARVIETLNYLARRENPMAKTGTLVTLHISRSEIAAYAGLSRESVSRTMANLGLSHRQIFDYRLNCYDPAPIEPVS